MKAFRAKLVARVVQIAETGSEIMAVVQSGLLLA
ncbi:hypothetical protein H359_0446, partial [Chlamydia ibidis 10-1398/6]